MLNYEKTIFDKKIAKCDTMSFNLEKQKQLPELFYK